MRDGRPAMGDVDVHEASHVRSHDECVTFHACTWESTWRVMAIHVADMDVCGLASWTRLDVAGRETWVNVDGCWTYVDTRHGREWA